MTAQIHDIIFFQDQQFSIVLKHGSGLVNPEHFGLILRPMHTACYRGYYLEYSIHDKNLFLTKITARDVRDTYPPISGVDAKPLYYKTSDGEIIEAREHVYEGLQLPVAFSGKLWIAHDFISEMYVHGGFQRPSSFRTVYELLLEDGTITSVSDFSEEMERRRQAGCIPFGWIFRWFS